MPVSLAQRQAIIAAIKEGRSSEDIAAQVGVSKGTVIAVKANLSRRPPPFPSDDVEDVEGAEEEVANAVDTAFGLERDLQKALRENIEQLEPGLTISDGGKEKTVRSGRIDITAQDRDGATVIELKVGTADRDAIGQLAAYMGDLTEKGARVRGILIAREFASPAVSAARVIPSLRLVRYGFRFTFETAAGSSS